jgi:predicted pyridoxine 5'-phosphate oxidase superfamily flavin-nucleotide-binding protein
VGSAILSSLGILTEDMQRVVRQQRLGFYATVCDDGSPNLSPKGTTFVLDDDHLCFADVRSPQTVANIRRGSLVEVNVIDPLARKGYRFKGPAEVHDPGTDVYSDCLGRLRDAGSSLVDRVKAIVVVTVQSSWWRCSTRVRFHRRSTTTAASPRPRSSAPSGSASLSPCRDRTRRGPPSPRRAGAACA